MEKISFINIKPLGKSIKSTNSNIWMFHRIQTGKNNISEIYNKRNMLHTYKQLESMIDKSIQDGKHFGSIEQAIVDENVIHLTFDDGYKEHLFVARALKKQFNFSKDCITFSINIRNSFYEEKFSMDMVYELIDNNLLHKLTDKLGINVALSDDLIGDIKNKLFETKKNISIFDDLNCNTENYFLNEKEVISLSKMYSIASHCINHCHLNTMTKEDIIFELKESKKILESKLKTNISTICYPDGKSNVLIEQIAKQCEYKYGLSISKGNGLYKIRRVIP